MRRVPRHHLPAACQEAGPSHCGVGAPHVLAGRLNILHRQHNIRPGEEQRPIGLGAGA
eukprot:CAMPEP_0182536572 /NCGR_PEP_ID=MMETSP1323-20130603/20317_1 /TAXON_ID=236787 /ORGANISM="Florenciella parvula, Strain RCC1693" /LENGTH=57 /DNA_ID=CAMNT_0024746829 /DNA_START=1 /DNA_END=174 /DNA_ORIENTATION=-